MQKSLLYYYKALFYILQELLNPKAVLTIVEESLFKGDIASYRQAREKVAEQGVIYKDDTSMLKLFQRHKIKAKTGRPVHIKADPELQEALKKTSEIT